MLVDVPLRAATRRAGRDGIPEPRSVGGADTSGGGCCSRDVLVGSEVGCGGCVIVGASLSCVGCVVVGCDVGVRSGVRGGEDPGTGEVGAVTGSASCQSESSDCSACTCSSSVLKLSESLSESVRRPGGLSSLLPSVCQGASALAEGAAAVVVQGGGGGGAAAKAVAVTAADGLGASGADDEADASAADDEVAVLPFDGVPGGRGGPRKSTTSMWCVRDALVGV
mmetsp:Transcript_24196/g.78861  ORF Transcript_24196/g.78861 Transcript_24196/m.78861 type:complete len:224 (+) Transcript_24196:561-1232(+)